MKGADGKKESCVARRTIQMGGIPEKTAFRSSFPILRNKRARKTWQDTALRGTGHEGYGWQWGK